MSVVASGRRRRRAIVLAVTGALALVTAAVVWSGVSAWHAKDQLTAAVPAGREVAAALEAGDIARADAALVRLQGHAEQARALSASPVWAAVETVPWLGAQLSAVRTVAASLSTVASEGLPPLIEAVGTVAGHADAAAISATREPLARAAAAFGQAREAVAQIDTSALAAPVADGIGQARAAVTEAATAVDALARGAAIVPGLLGADGPRDVLVMLQNNAEVRTGGGITGTFVQLHVADGRVSLSAQADSTRFAPLDEPFVAIPEATQALYGDVVGRFVQNATMTSDFALSARLASSWWERETGVAPDAVVAIDPLVLAALLGVTGPVTLADGSTLDQGSVIPRLLVEPYRTLDAPAQTAYLEGVTASVFSSLVDRVDPLGWARALAPAVSEGRIAVWSAVPQEQEALAESGVGGMLARVGAAGPDAYGVYLNDATGGKMDGYLAVSMDGGTISCGPGRLPESVVRVTLRNDAPADAWTWPLSVTGGGLWGTAMGDIGTLVSVSAPAGAGFGGAFAADGTAVTSANALDAGRPTTAVRINVSPGESETIAFRFVAAAGAGEPIIVHTPMITPVAVAAASDIACRS